MTRSGIGLDEESRVSRARREAKATLLVYSTTTFMTLAPLIVPPMIEKRLARII